MLEVEHELQGASSAVLPAHHRAFEETEKAWKCREKLDNAIEQFEGAQVSAVANKVHDDAIKTGKRAAKSIAQYIANVGRRQEEVEELTR